MIFAIGRGVRVVAPRLRGNFRRGTTLIGPVNLYSR